MQPLSGSLTDIFGRRNGLVLANIFFGAGTVLCGFAREEWVIILGRVIAGIGGGCLNTISVFVASDLIPLRRRGVWQGFGNISFALGSGLGGLFGGWVSDVWSWRWAFWIQVPFVVISTIGVFFAVDIPIKETNKSRLKRVDFLGAVLLIFSLVSLLLGLNSGGNIVPWNHPLVYITIPLSGVFLAAFVYIEDKIATEPIIPVRLLLDRTVYSACLVNWFGSMAQLALLFYAPLYFQVRGLSATRAGAQLIPSSLGLCIGSLGSGMIMRASGRYYYLLSSFTTVYTVGFVLMVALLDVNTPLWPPIIMYFLAGLGYGGILTVTLIALISAVDHKYQAVITSASYAFRSTGSTIGISIASAVFQNKLQSQLKTKFGKDKTAIAVKVRNDIHEIYKLPTDLKQKALEAYMDAFKGVWASLLAMVLIATILGFFVREHVLHTNLARK